jgi:hypothetical protein
MIRRHLHLICFSLGVFLLAGCGVAGADVGASTMLNTSPTTVSNGPVSISTDHSEYAPTDIIHATVTNKLTVPIYAFDHQASCSIFSLQFQRSGQWIPITQSDPGVAGCARGTATGLIAIQPGASYTAHIMAGYLRQGDHHFSLGKYRLVLVYTLSPAQLDAKSFATVYSVTISVVGNVAPLPTQRVPSAKGNGSPQP